MTDKVHITIHGIQAFEWDGDAGQYLEQKISTALHVLRCACQIDADVTLGDIFRAVEQDPQLVRFLQEWSWCNVDAFHLEARKPTGKRSDLAYIEIAKYFEWERKGVPVRIEIGPRDVAKQSVMLVWRLELGGRPRKEPMLESVVVDSLPERLEQFQQALLDAAIARREANSYRGVTEYARLREIVEGAGGFVYAGWCGSPECEEKVKDDTKATIRCIPFEEFRSPEAPARCLVCGGEAKMEVIWARAY